MCRCCVLVLRSAEWFQRLVGSDELWLNLGPRAGAMRSRTHEVRKVACSFPHARARAREIAARARDERGEQIDDRGQRERRGDSLAEIELCWRSGKLASAARELKEAVSAGGALEQRPIGCSDRPRSRQAADQSTLT